MPWVICPRGTSISRHSAENAWTEVSAILSR